MQPTLRRRTAVCCSAMLLALAVVGGQASPLIAADSPEIAEQASATEVFEGESLEYLVEIRNVKNPSPPDLSAFESDFEVVANGDESRNQSSTFIVNGRVSQQNRFSHLFRYRLTPRRSGELTIPAPTATIDGKQYRGRSLTLQVQAPEEQDLVIPEIRVDRSRVYPTQPFEVTLRVAVRPLPDAPQRDPLTPLRRQPPKIEVNWVDLPPGLTGEEKSTWLQNQLAEDGVGFALNDVTLRGGLFLEGPRAAVFKLRPGRETRPDREGNDIRYHTYELKRTITPEKTGTYTLGPAIVKGSFVEGMDGRSYLGKRLVAIAPAVTVEVREVPQPRPPTFCGGIGGYHAAVSASPATLRVGDPLTLSVEVTRSPGSGSFDLVFAPDLSANPQLAADFEIVDRNPTGRVLGESKRFDYALRPRKAGVSVPAITVTVFDPETEQFVDTVTRPVPLTVAEATRIGAGDLVGSAGGTTGRDIRSQEQGIYQNITDPRELADQSLPARRLLALAAGGWLAAAGGIAWITRRRRLSGDLVGQRRRSALRAAERRLGDARTALAEGRQGDALRTARTAILGLIADSRNLVAEGLTASDADQELARSPLPSSDRQQIRQMLEAMEAAEYGAGDLGEVSTVLQTIERHLPVLARGLERNRDT